MSQKVCPCTDQKCIKTNNKCESTSGGQQISKNSLTTDFRKLVYSKHEDIILTIFDFEESSTKKLDANKQKIDALRKDIEVMKKDGDKIAQNEKKERDLLISRFNGLNEQYKIERAKIISEHDEKFQEVVTIFNTNMQKVQTAIEQHWIATLQSSKETSVKFNAGLSSFKDSAVNEINHKSEMVEKLQELLNKSEQERKNFESKKSSLQQLVQFDVDDVNNKMNEITSVHKKLQEKYKDFLGLLSKRK